MPNVIEFHPERNNDDWRVRVEGLLKVGNGKFHFQKVDGSLRDMFCTLQPSVLPEDFNTELTNQSKPGVLTIWDIENNGWRSMRYENVIQFKFLGDQTTDPEHESTFIQQ
jgi:hypothetical protein